MAIHKREKGTDLPEDAVLMTSEEAYNYQIKIIDSWEKTSDIWALRYGSHILGVLSSATGIYVNSFYRGKLKLGNYGKLSSYLPIVVLPAIMSVVYHKGFIQRSILLETLPCPLCLETKAAMYQSGFGVIYPTLLAPLASFVFATRHFTYRLPSIIEKPKEVFMIWKKLSKPLIPFVSTALAAQALISMYITFKAMDQNYFLQLKFLKEENKILHGS